MIPFMAAIISIVFVGVLMIILTPEKKKEKTSVRYKDFFIDADDTIVYYKGIDTTV
jgi:hypothetical protein